MLIHVPKVFFVIKWGAVSIQPVISCHQVVLKQSLQSNYTSNSLLGPTPVTASLRNLYSVITLSDITPAPKLRDRTVVAVLCMTYRAVLSTD